MSNKKQTAVDWFINEINIRKCWIDLIQLQPLIEQAKQIEKEQIKNAFNEGFRQGELTEIPEINKIKDIFLFNDAENYYTETYEN